MEPLKLDNKTIADYKTFLRFETISSDPTKKSALISCAQWLINYLKKTGLSKVSMYKSQKHPIVYGEYISHPSFKTILFYGHYDVQPVTPITQWKYKPFEPTIDGNYIYARGASDDKGQIFIHIKAIEHVLKNKKSLKINIKCLFEGEEEIGSPGLSGFINDNKKLLQCDAIVVSDTKMLSANVPAITYSLRGSLNAEIIIQGRQKDLHSGTFGGMVPNTADVLCQLLGKIIRQDGKISIPGFYSGISPLNEKEKLFMKRSGPSDQSLFSDASSNISWGEKGFSNYEKTTIRPSFVITSLQAGHTGEGIKNVIPSSAMAKINIRLVNGQEPGKIATLFNSFIKQNMLQGFKYIIRYSSAVRPVEVSRTHPFLYAAFSAYKKVFNHSPVMLRSGGTIPVVSLFTYNLRTPVILMGFALASDNMHAPNERFFLPNLFKGISTIVEFIKNIYFTQK